MLHFFSPRNFLYCTHTSDQKQLLVLWGRRVGGCCVVSMKPYIVSWTCRAHTRSKRTTTAAASATASTTTFIAWATARRPSSSLTCISTAAAAAPQHRSISAAALQHTSPTLYSKRKSCSYIVLYKKKVQDHSLELFFSSSSNSILINILCRKHLNFDRNWCLCWYFYIGIYITFSFNGAFTYNIIT